MGRDAGLAADLELFVEAVMEARSALAGLDGVARLKEAEVRLADLGNLIAGVRVHGQMPGLDRAVEGVAAVVGAAGEASTSLYSPSRVAEANNAVDAMMGMFGGIADRFATPPRSPKVGMEVAEAKVAGFAGLVAEAKRDLASMERECSGLRREIEEEVAALMEPPAPRKGVDPDKPPVRKTSVDMKAIGRRAGAAAADMGKGTGRKGPGM